MLEALWSVVFISNSNVFGSGVVILETCRVLGGDAQYFYVGNYSVNNETVNATVTITQYFGSHNSVIGDTGSATFQLSGNYSHDKFELIGYDVGNPSKKRFFGNLNGKKKA